MSLQDSLSGFVGQCVGWVEATLPWVQKGPAYAADYITALPRQGATAVSSTMATAGDVVVWAAGQGGASSPAGHIAVVTGRDAQTGDIEVSQANWGENGLPSVMTIKAAAASGLHFFAPPAGWGPQSQTNALISRQAAGGRSSGTDSSSAGSPLTLTSGTKPMPLSSVTNDAGFLGSDVPGHLAQWAAQSSLKWSLVVDAASVGLLLLGVWLVFRQSPGDLVEGVQGAVADVAAKTKKVGLAAAG